MEVSCRLGPVRELIETLNRSSFTRRHLAFYLTIVFCHFFYGFDIQMMGFPLPGIAAVRERVAAYQSIFDTR